MSDPLDDTSADYEQFEQALLAQDCDAATVATGDVDDTMARNLVSELVDADIITPFPRTESSFTSRVALLSTRPLSWPSSTRAGRPRRRRGGQVVQQTLVGCAFCDVSPGTETGQAHTWGQDERVTHPICVDCVIQTRPDPGEHGHHACDGCGLVIDALAASPVFHAGFPLDLRSRSAHAVPRLRTVVIFYMLNGYTFNYSDEIRALLHRFGTDEAAVDTDTAVIYFRACARLIKRRTEYLQ